MHESPQPVVLVVEDDPEVAETFALWLEDYDVRRAGTGEEALERIDDTVDVVLLDRKLPGIDGQEVLADIRSRGIDSRVAMVTAVEPGFDIIEMGFDEYLRKPPSRGELVDTVDRLIHRGTLDEDLQEYYSLIARRSTLEAEYETADLESNEEYADLVEQIERFRTAVDDAMGDLSSDSGFIGAVREIMDGLTGDTPQNHDNSEEE